MLTNIEIDAMHAIIRIAHAIEEQNKMLAEITPKSKLPKVGAALPGAALIAGAIPFADAIPFAAEILIVGAAMLAAGCVLTRGGKSGY